jgi:hypothetical protein
MSVPVFISFFPGVVKALTPQGILPALRYRTLIFVECNGKRDLTIEKNKMKQEDRRDYPEVARIFFACCPQCPDKMGNFVQDIAQRTNRVIMSIIHRQRSPLSGSRQPIRRRRKIFPWLTKAMPKSKLAPLWRSA